MHLRRGIARIIGTSASPYVDQRQHGSKTAQHAGSDSRPSAAALCWQPRRRSRQRPRHLAAPGIAIRHPLVPICRYCPRYSWTLPTVMLLRCAVRTLQQDEMESMIASCRLRGRAALTQVITYVEKQGKSFVATIILPAEGLEAGDTPQLQWCADVRSCGQTAVYIHLFTPVAHPRHTQNRTL